MAWMLLPGDARDRFWDPSATTGPTVDDVLITCARGRATAFALMFLARSTENRQMAAMGTRTSRALRNEPRA